MNDLAPATYRAVLIPASVAHAQVTSDIAALLNAVRDQDRPEQEAALTVAGLSEAVDQTCLQVIVAPSTARGLVEASERITTWHPHQPQPALLVVRDAPLPPPPIVVQRARALSERLAASVEIPYLYQLRMVEDPLRLVEGQNKDVRRLRRVLRKALTQLQGASFQAGGGAPRVPVPDLELPSNQEPAPSPAPSPAAPRA